MSALTIEVSPELLQRLREQAEERGLSMDTYLREALQAIVTPEVAPAQQPGTSSLLELFDEIWAGVPEEEWERLPTDLAEQHDHYIYGTRKHQP